MSQTSLTDKMVQAIENLNTRLQEVEDASELMLGLVQTQQETIEELQEKLLVTEIKNDTLIELIELMKQPEPKPVQEPKPVRKNRPRPNSAPRPTGGGNWVIGP